MRGDHDERSRIVPPGGGVGYECSADYTFVKVGADDTGGAYALMEGNLKPGFALGLHRHDHHAELLRARWSDRVPCER